MIPGVLISILTFPGVILHEFAHKFFCDRFGVKVHEVSYFNVSGGGHVIHDRTDDFNAIFWISTGPLIINSLTAILLASIASNLSGEEGIYLLLLWLAVSFGAHSLPSNQDTSNVLDASKQIIKTGGSLLHYLSFPFVWFFALANLLRFFWIDFIWAIVLIGVGFTLGGNGDAVDGFLSDTGTPNTQDGSSYSIVGDYSCTDYHYNKADTLAPTQGDDSLIHYKQLKLDSLLDEIDAESVRLENMYVNEYSQTEINSYNTRVNELKRKSNQHEKDYNDYESMRTIHNLKIDAYNDYLKRNCTDTR
jgi:hypothetical protein